MNTQLTANLPRSPELVVAEVIVGDIKALEAGEVAEDVFTDIVDNVMRHVEPLEVFGAVE